MATAPTDNPVRHNPDASRFEAIVDGRESVAEYVVEGRSVVFTHTFVPPELRGRGLAEKLVRAGLDWTRAQGFRAVPQCSYVDAYIRRHPEYQDLLQA